MTYRLKLAYKALNLHGIDQTIEKAKTLIPICRGCGQQINQPHWLGCHYVCSHYDQVQPSQCN